MSYNLIKVKYLHSTELGKKCYVLFGLIFHEQKSKFAFIYDCFLHTYVNSMSSLCHVNSFFKVDV